MAKNAFQKCVSEKTKGRGGSQATVQRRLAKAAKECAAKHGK